MAKTSRSLTLDWTLLRPALQKLVVLATLSGVLFGSTYFYARSAEREQAHQEARLASERRAYYRSREARETLTRFSSQYQYWQGRGVIGDEQRLQWIEVLQSAATALKLPEMNYSISPSKTASDLSEDMPREVLRSRMELSMKLVHERDLLDLTKYLERHTLGLFWVTQCDLTHENSMPESNKGLRAQCVLEWLTVPETPKLQEAEGA